MSEVSENETPKKGFFCEVCDRNVRGIKERHDRGQKHVRLMNFSLSDEMQRAFSKVVDDGNYCNVCQSVVGAKGNLPQHLRGRRHHRMLRKRKKLEDRGEGSLAQIPRRDDDTTSPNENPNDGNTMPPPVGRAPRRSARQAASGSRASSAGASSENPTNDDIREKPPPHLKGKALGLWYRDRKRNMKNTKKEKEKQPIPLDLGKEKLQQIQKILGNINIQEELQRITESSGPSDSTSKYDNIKDSAFKYRFLKSVTGSLQEKMKEGIHYTKLDRRPYMDDDFKKELYDKYDNSRKFNEMLQFRKKLPAYDKRKDIIEALEKTSAILISGETGCGKTTQVAQFLLEHEILSGYGSVTHIVCTQPRRISAISVAERVAAERGESLGRSVGYQIRLEKIVPRERASILFCTTGVLLQYMHGDPLLKFASHIIIDEVHERDTLSDFVITLLRDILPARKDLKVILMSATLNADKFSKYLNNCPTIHIPGFTFPVTEYYLEDVLKITDFKIPNTKKEKKQITKEREAIIMPFIRKLQASKQYPQHVIDSLSHFESEEINFDLIVELITRICHGSSPHEAILVFMTGWDKISKLNRMLTEEHNFSPDRYVIVPLHSLMPTTSQRTVFDRPPPGKRKIVIATNIAETSITIDDIVHVIDCGKIKMKNFDIESNLTTLKEEWVSLANAKQRRGRAGRVQEGFCYHLFTRGREMMLESYQLPEMLRTRLEEVILQLKILQLGKAAPFLSKVLDPPDSRAVDLSIRLLKGMRALDEDEDLTPLGYHLANLPVDPQGGKMLLFAAMFSCFDPICSIVSCLGFKDPFHIPLGKEKEVDKRKKEISGGMKSDHLLLADIVSMWEQQEASYRGSWEFCRKNYLSLQNLRHLRDMKQQFAKQLCEMNYIPSPDVKSQRANLNSNKPGLLKAILCAGLYPNIAIITHQKWTKSGVAFIKIRTPEDGKVSLHPKSVNNNECDFRSRFLVYFEKIKSSGIFLHDTTMITPLALLFFCQNLTAEPSSDGQQTIISVNDHICFLCSHSTAQLIQDLRKGLDWILEYKISHPGVTDLSSHSDDIETRLIKAIIELITIEDEEVNYDPVDNYTDSDN